MTAALLLAGVGLLVGGGADPHRARLSALGAAGRLGVAAGPGRPGGRVGVGREGWGRFGAAAAVIAPGAVATAVAGPVVGLAVGAIVALAVRLVADVLARRRAVAARAAVRAAVQVLADELSAGSRPPAALAAAAGCGRSVHDVFTRAAGDAARGEASTALLVDARVEVRALGVAWQLGSRTGSALAGLVGHVADDLAAEDAHRRAVAVALAGPRASAVLVALLPVLGLVLGTAMGAAPVHVLGGSPTGRALLLAGVLLDVAGVLWVRALLRRAERP